MSLLLAHPELPTCTDCQKYLYDPKNWTRVKQAGKDLLRQAHAPTPCDQCPKIPKGESPCPANAVELSRDSIAAYLLYKEIKAGRPMPNDPIVWRNCAMLMMVEESYDRGLEAASSQNVQWLGGIIAQGLTVRRK